MSSNTLWKGAVQAQEMYDSQGDVTKLTKAVEWFRQLKDDTESHPEDAHPHAISCRLSRVLIEQCWACNRPEALEEAIAVARAAYEVCSVSCPDHPDVLCAFGASVLRRHSILGDHQDLLDALDVLQRSVDSCPPQNEYRARCLYTLARALGSHSDLMPNLELRERVIQLLRDALSLMDTPIHFRTNICHALAVALWDRYENFGDIQYLENALIISRETISLRPSEHIRCWETYNCMSCIYYSRYLQSANPEDLDDAVVFARRSISVRSPNSLGSEYPLVNLGNALAHRGEATGDMRDADEAIVVYQEALCFAVQYPKSSFLGTLLHNLGGCLAQRFELARRPEDLEQSVAHLRHALSVNKEGSPGRSATLQNLGYILCKRYIELGHSEDLDDSIQFCREAISLGENDPRMGQPFLSLALSLVDRHSGIADIEEAISLLRSASEAGVWEVDVLLGLARALLRRGESLSSREDIDEALHSIENAMKTPSITPYQRQSMKQNLGDGFYSRYKLFRSLDDLIRSHNIHEEVQSGELDLVARYRCNMSLAQIHLESNTPFFNPETGARLIQTNLMDSERSAQLRLRDGVHFLRTVQPGLRTTTAEHRAAMLAVYEHAIRLLPHTTYFGTNIRFRLDALRDAEELSLCGAITALSLSMSEQALEILEQGRGIFWTQGLQLRTPVEEVPEVLRTRLTDLSRRLEARSFAMSRGHDSKEDVEREAARNRQETEQFNEVLHQIRTLEGFERFLLHETAERLMEAGDLGPVVILLADSDCSYAIIVDAVRRLQILEFRGVDQNWLSATTKTWESLTQSSRNRNVDLERLEIKKRTRIESQRYALKEKRLLEDLWNKIVSPVINLLDLKPQAGRARPRLWWIPTGTFSFLPLHAAGTARVHSSTYVVSSYSPTLTTLLNVRRSYHHVRRDTVQVLLGAVPSAPSEGVQDLPQTVEEISIIRDTLVGVPTHQDRAVKNTEMVHVKQGITVEEMLDILPQSHVLHLACHGQQDLHNPLESRFILRDGPVSIATLMPLPLPRAFFAFLSACETAKGDESQPDQLIHLAATMLFAGFKSVIGTMWNMNDYDGPFVSKIVYQQLFAPGIEILDPDTIPYALDDAVQQLRDQGISPSRWATYIHLGM